MLSNSDLEQSAPSIGTIVGHASKRYFLLPSSTAIKILEAFNVTPAPAELLEPSMRILNLATEWSIKETDNFEMLGRK